MGSATSHTDSTAAGSGGSRWRPTRAQLIAAGAVGGAALLSRAPGLLNRASFDSDETFILVSGRVIAAGGDPYLTAIDRKPPLPAVLASLVADAGDSQLLLLRLMLLAALVVAGLSLAATSRQLGVAPRSSLIGAVVFLLSTAWFLPAHAQAANFTMWGLPFSLLGIVLALRGFHATGWQRPVQLACAGGAFALACMSKQTYVVDGAVVALIWWGQGRVNRRVGDLLIWLGAAVLGIAALTAPFDAAQLVRWVVLDNADYYAGISWVRVASRAVIHTVLAAALLGPVVYLAARGLRGGAPRWALLWLVLAALGVCMGLRFFGHYYVQLLAPLAILACYGADTLRSQRAIRTVLGAAVALTLILGIVALPSSVQPPAEALLGVITSESAPDERVLVWGRNPAINVAADRLPGLPFLHGAFLTGEWAELPAPEDPYPKEPFASRWKQTLEYLDADPPRLVVDLSGNVANWANWPIEATPLGSRLESDYTLIAEVDGARVWRRG